MEQCLFFFLVLSKFLFLFSRDSHYPEVYHIHPCKVKSILKQVFHRQVFINKKYHYFAHFQVVYKWYQILYIVA